MSKKAIGVIVVVLLLAVIGFGAYKLYNDKIKDDDKLLNNTNENKDNLNDNNSNENDDKTNSDVTVDSKKTIVVYFSATNNTKSVAEKIAENLNGDIFEIIPEDEYTSEDLNYGNSNSRVSKEHDDISLRNVKLKTTEVENWASYDTVLIGYPIWWGVAAWPVDTFVKANDFIGKTIIPFCTSASSSLGQSGELLKDEANGGNWLEGRRFSSRPTDADIKSFTNSIK